MRQTQSDAKKVLDIAAGHGLFGIEIAKRLPEAEIVELDWPNVLAVAQELAREVGVQSRYRTITGDAYTFKEYEQIFSAAGFSRTANCIRCRDRSSRCLSRISR